MSCGQQRNINSLYDSNNVAFTCRAAHPQVACAGEVFSVLVEGNRHHTVCGVESLLHTVPVVNVDIYVQNSLVISGTKMKNI